MTKRSVTACTFSADTSWPIWNSYRSKCARFCSYWFLIVRDSQMCSVERWRTCSHFEMKKFADLKTIIGDAKKIHASFKNCIRFSIQKCPCKIQKLKCDTNCTKIMFLRRLCSTTAGCRHSTFGRRQCLSHAHLYVCLFFFFKKVSLHVHKHFFVV